MEPRRLKAAAVASYFRSAITGTSSKRASGGMGATSEGSTSVAGANIERAAEYSTGVVPASGDDATEASESTLNQPLAVGQVVDPAAIVAAVVEDHWRVCAFDGDERGSSNDRKVDDEIVCPSGSSILECKHDNTEEAKSDTTSRKYEVTYEYSPEDDEDEDKELYSACGGEACSHDVCNDGSCYHSDQINNSSNGGSEKKLVLQYIDVLLQADSHGLGLNIQVAQRNPLSQCSQNGSSLVVASFRRLHPRDIGPAEATRQIQRGDVLHSIDGDEVHDLQQLHSKLQAKRLGGSADNNERDAPYVLLRFLRQLSLLNGSDSASTSSLTTEEEEEPVVTKSSNSSVSPRTQEYDPQFNATAHGMVGYARLGNTHQVAMVIRELATKNQELQQELVASKLKLAEHNIQLEQLYALYAKTKLESSPVLTFTKSLRPFGRRASASEKNGVGGCILRSGSASKLHSDIEFAVQAERERLQKHYQLQRDIEKRQVATRHRQELQTLKDTMEKKLAMLEMGFQEALKQQQELKVSKPSIETCSCGTWMRLQQELYIHQSLNHDGDEDGDDGSECLVCSLLTDARRTTISYPNDTTDESVNSRRMEKVLEVLREYDLLKQKRPQCLVVAGVGDTEKGFQLDLENPLQP